MNRDQAQACAACMPDGQAAAFLALTQASNDLFTRSVELRLQAWDLYRATTGLRKSGKPIRPFKAPEAGSASK